ncbi:hypothetical protein N9L75_03550 [Porticoccaceae bacterium]|nr:hypothetical protein [Porticoccaceae bacterium]MDA8651630.1 hypothetical protein [Porticoccaceae bacterium]MDA8682426.1 hypothetical protein [Porticoccaceae bacterium]MDB2343142.1 hypothetical protein [Porticoccaceae bacterium]MDB2664435.1 hypothetical protein [Porticoccaceae bacterium]
METLFLNVFGIVITWDGQDRGGASITSDMKDTDDGDNNAFNTGVDGIESIVLGHFCAGLDVTEPAYLQGIETAYQSLCNNYDSTLASAKPKLQFAIHLEGGLVQSVFCQDTQGFDCEFTMFDYDIDGVEDDQLGVITQPDGEKAEAYFTQQTLSENPAINLGEVFNG